MKLESVGVGLLGFGWIAEIAHVPTLLGARNARLVAAADRDPGRRARLGQLAPAVPTHPSWEPLLSDAAIDAVVIALPTALHADAACAALAAGKHVFLEKPLAVNQRDGIRITESWRRAGTVGMIGYNFRRSSIAEHATRALAAGELGRLVGIQASFQWAADSIEGWRTRPDEGGGALLDLASHHIDLVTALTGERVVRVTCAIWSIRSPDDTATVTLTLESGVVAQLFASSAAGAPANRLELLGTTGALTVDLLEARPAPVRRRPGPGARVERAVQALGGLHPARLLRSPGSEPSFRATLLAFLDAARTGAPTRPDLSDGLDTLRVVEAARASVRANGVPVQVEWTS